MSKLWWFKVVVIPLGKRYSLSIVHVKIWVPLPKDVSCQVWLKLPNDSLEKKIFKSIFAIISIIIIYYYFIFFIKKIVAHCLNSRGCFVYNLVEISKVVLEKIHKMLSISFRYYLSLERGVALHLNTTESSFVLSFIETGPVVLDKTIKMCLYHSINK